MVEQLCMMVLLLAEVFVGLYGDVTQLNPVVSVHEGDPVVLPCFIKTKQINVASWYKQVTGEEPRLIACFIRHSSISQFHSEFENNHFDVLRGTDSFNLTIMNTAQSDSGTYYCAFSFSNIVSFGNGTRLVIKEPKVSKPTNLQLPKIELIKTEVNVPLRCSVQNELVSSGGEHRLYWFKHGSEESPPGSLYVHGNTSDGCVRSSEADCFLPTCMYNLPKNKFSSSQTATYCALATCGEILFGNISKHNPDNFKSQNTHLLFVTVLTVLLTSNITINILLCCMRRNESINATESKYKQIQTSDDDVSIAKNVAGPSADSSAAVAVSSVMEVCVHAMMSSKAASWSKASPQTSINKLHEDKESSE
ncbi:uncharacterized protein LOC127167565 [Labeo rohita]|uniref:uncharacterized protein LOC127167565 n=1 Tax=Labeo rohita TaxID=84645 RepID=UPI0021E21225|nr:uncharacterized protein LOC127167565 [Labeo rohita]